MGDGVIALVEAAGERVNGTGKVLLPGFIDLHAYSAPRSFDDAF
ncbi:hypothetical protein [Saccharopolyspora sp. ASAGF58]|nr:hypothetical protein [Saccharopolyspora sp. ASAGF58]